jgi:hypothetical protein
MFYMTDTLAVGPPLYFYDGKVTLYFDKDTWTYYRVCADNKLEPQYGVTGVCHVIDKSLYLVPWACKMMYLRVLKLMPRAGDRVMTASIPWVEFDELLQEAKKAHKDKLEEAGDIGTIAHTWIEDSIRNAITFNDGIVEKMNEMAPTDERAVNCGLAAFDWMVKHNVRWKSTERKIYSLKYGYAGTCDGTAIVDGCNDPACCPKLFQDEFSLIDWKSSNSLRTEYLYQTAAYQYAIEEETKQAIRARWILRLGKEDGKFESWYETDFEQDFSGYLACLELHKIHKAVEKRMSSQKKLKIFKKREVAKEVKERAKFEKRVTKDVV